MLPRYPVEFAETRSSGAAGLHRPLAGQRRQRRDDLRGPGVRRLLHLPHLVRARRVDPLANRSLDQPKPPHRPRLASRSIPANDAGDAAAVNIVPADEPAAAALEPAYSIDLTRIDRPVLVAGAGGFIGGHLVQRLVEAGESVRAVDAKPLHQWDRLDDRVDNVVLDLRDPGACRRAAEGVGTIFSLATDTGGLAGAEPTDASRMLTVVINANLFDRGPRHGRRAVLLRIVGGRVRDQSLRRRAPRRATRTPCRPTTERDGKSCSANACASASVRTTASRPALPATARCTGRACLLPRPGGRGDGDLPQGGADRDDRRLRDRDPGRRRAAAQPALRRRLRRRHRDAPRLRPRDAGQSRGVPSGFGQQRRCARREHRRCHAPSPLSPRRPDRVAGRETSIRHSPGPSSDGCHRSASRTVSSRRIAGSSTGLRSGGMSAPNRSPLTRVDVLGLPVSAGRADEALDVVTGWIERRERSYATFMTVHAVMESQRRTDVLAAHRGAGLVACDGMPLVWATRRAGVVASGAGVRPGLHARPLRARPSAKVGRRSSTAASRASPTPSPRRCGSAFPT